MAATRQWLNQPYGHNGDAFGVCVMSFALLKYCQGVKIEALHVLLPASCIAYSKCVPISGGVPSSSG